MLLVREYLKVKSLEDLEQEHGVKASVEEHKFSLNYCQINSDEKDPLAKQCRGLILRTENPEKTKIDRSTPVGNTVILARPLDRFYNYGQECADDVDLNHPATSFYEKLDGSLCLVYFDDYKQEWHVATRSVPEANLPIDGFYNKTFRSLFEEALKETTNKDFGTWTSEYLFSDTTYMFELTTPYNRIVVDYEKPGVTLIAARKTATGKELHPAFVQAQVRTPTAERYRFNKESEVIKFVSGRDPMKHEGIVVCDHKFRRIKIKNSEYVALHRMKSSILSSPRGLVELVLLEKLDDAVALLPEHVVKEANRLVANLRKAGTDYRKVYNECMKEADKVDSSDEVGHRKAFALAVKSNDAWVSPMMAEYDGRTYGLVNWLTSKKQKNGFFAKSFLDKVWKYLNKYNEPVADNK